MAAGFSASAFAGRNGVNRIKPNPLDSIPVFPGQVLWTHYETAAPFNTCPGASNPEQCDSGGNGDSLLRLLNPNGSANTGLAGELPQTVCAMIYVFDTDQEMGECCGCPLSSTKLTNFSVKNNLLSNFILGGGNDYGNGAIAVVASNQNADLLPTTSGNNGQGCIAGQSTACHSGCDPTDWPGYIVSNELLGSMTHSQYVAANPGGSTSNITESQLWDDGPGNEANLLYLQMECGILVGNASGGGSCTCPPETVENF